MGPRRRGRRGRDGFPFWLSRATESRSISDTNSGYEFCFRGEVAHLIDVTSQPLATAYLQMREPRNPFPPHTTILFDALADIFSNRRPLDDAEIDARSGKTRLVLMWSPFMCAV